jgi:uncharacterized membrane protein
VVPKISRSALWFNSITAVNRLLGCLLLAGGVFGILSYYQLELFTRLMISWDSFCLVLISVCWITFFITPTKLLGVEAQKQDESRPVIFVIVLLSLCIGLLATLVLLRSDDTTLISKGLHYGASMIGVVLSWILLHTTFTLRYAHLYYTQHPNNPALHAGGLRFPEEAYPDYLDFAYYSFVLGMTFQVSDVNITSKQFRRLALLQGLIAFVFNSIVIALTINGIANLR